MKIEPKTIPVSALVEGYDGKDLRVGIKEPHFRILIRRRKR